MKASHLKDQNKTGFTLVELMMVLSIILIIASVTTFKLRSAKPIEAAQIFESMTSFARVEAMRTSATTRIAIQDDTSVSETHLRKIVVVILTDHDGDESTAPVWRTVSSKEIPEGTLLNADLSGPLSGDDDEMQLDVEALVSSGNSGANFRFLEFNPLGQCKSSFQWIFTSGVVDSAGRVASSNENDLDGFIVRKTGQTAYFSRPDQISPPSS